MADKYDVMLKQLEVIEKDHKITKGTLTDERVVQITNVIQYLRGNILQEQSAHTEVVVEGDRFENISQSVIATRGAIAKGIIGIREQHGDSVADALETLHVYSGQFGHLFRRKAAR